ncbi:hypothetical protein ACLOJK_012368 [Asimina triloba]
MGYYCSPNLRLKFNPPTLALAPTPTPTPSGTFPPHSAPPAHQKIFCSFPPRQHSGEHDHPENDDQEDSRCRPPKSQLDVRRTLLVERYYNGTAKRYILDNDSWIQIVLEENGFTARGLQMQEANSDVELSWVPQIVKDFIFPAGFPGHPVMNLNQFTTSLLKATVSLTKQHVCNDPRERHAKSNGMRFSVIFQAVGVGSFSGTTAAASAAAVRWVSKDGLGAIGRLFIGGRFGNLFDDDPKQWRMYADFVGSAGSIFELTTQLYPAYFLPLASLGNLTKEGLANLIVVSLDSNMSSEAFYHLDAVARGLKDPSFRVIQNHFAISSNLGEVAAKPMKGGAGSICLLLSERKFLLPAYWLHEHWRGADHIFMQLKESLSEMEGRFGDFLQQLNGAGWDTHKIDLKVPKEFAIETFTDS